jgi:hypothetical protein
MKAQLDLCLHNLVHSSVLDAGQLLLLRLAIVQVGSNFQKSLRAEERA